MEEVADQLFPVNPGIARTTSMVDLKLYGQHNFVPKSEGSESEMATEYVDCGDKEVWEMDSDIFYDE